MKKLVLLAYRLHRYLGIALAIPMLAWCLSGVVMMYVGYPSLPEEIRLGHLPSLVSVSYTHLTLPTNREV